MSVKDLLKLFEPSKLMPFVYIFDTEHKNILLNKEEICMEKAIKNYGSRKIKKYKIVFDDEGYDFCIYV